MRRESQTELSEGMQQHSTVGLLVAAIICRYHYDAKPLSHASGFVSPAVFESEISPLLLR
jgi:hypothetical protein